MRLLNSTTLQLAEFTERDLPPYAILSHTWETEEVSFQDMHNGAFQSKKGYKKIQSCCSIAAAAGFQHVWVDTCCIDKTSSAELTEAINSMYSWYQKADVCFVYLSDCHDGTLLSATGHSFRQSRWFTRGWTLQELLAPESVVFLNSLWQDIGTKHSLRKLISEITDIQVEALLGETLETFSVAQRMCWAARRETTRIEDEAYSLMGIFGVHMPMLYGEGSSAFIRLQEEIIKKSTDHTIFAWASGFPATRDYTGGLLADCPSTFANTKNIVRDPLRTSLPFEITNKGIHLHLPIYEESFGILDCHDLNRPTHNLAISLDRTPNSSDTFHFDPYRGTVNVTEDERENSPVHSIYVAQGGSIKPPPPSSSFRSAEFLFKFDFPQSGVVFRGCWPGSWSTSFGPRGTVVIKESGMPLRANFTHLGAIRFTNAAQNSLPVQHQDTITVVFKTENSVDDSQLDILLTALWLNNSLHTRIYDALGGGLGGAGNKTGRFRDEFLWQHPITKWWISVGMRRAIVSGKRTIIVSIKDATSEGA